MLTLAIWAGPPVGKQKTKQQSDLKQLHRCCKKTMVPKILDGLLDGVETAVRICDVCGREKAADIEEVRRIYAAVDWNALNRRSKR